MPNDDFISRYLEYRELTEPPRIFHRWSIISALSAFLGRQCWVQMGEAKIHPNQFVMLIGVPGTRKSTAIKMAKRLLQKTGYDTFSADKTSKEKFILDLAEPENSNDAANALERALFDEDSRGCSEIYIACDEFNNFIGNGNVEFVSLLGEWWDYEGIYKYRIKSGKSVEIPDPTINILGGNTSAGFNLAFPSQIIGQGFFSRLLLVHSDPSGRKITFPKSPSDEETNELVTELLAIKSTVSGAMQFGPGAEKLLDKIYRDGNPINDVRFEHYANRRFTHLLKLCQVVAASRRSNQISESDVVYANTILSHTESMMPKALGEHGAGRYAEVSHKIIQYLENCPKICSQADIWRQVNQDMDKINDLSNVLMNLKVADKIIQVDGGFIAKKAAVRVVTDGSVDYSLLTDEEQGGRYEFKPAIVAV